ncbi:hypothetical protein ACKN8S_10185 [Limosilactobacillus reuteri]|uniref:hypothetical protein n=1 Tax=Limosilactobacillus reuteri TaxID=1598 RepID=UPI0039BF8453
MFKFLERRKIWGGGKRRHLVVEYNWQKEWPSVWNDEVIFLNAKAGIKDAVCKIKLEKIKSHL